MEGPRRAERVAGPGDEDRRWQWGRDVPRIPDEAHVLRAGYAGGAIAIAVASTSIVSLSVMVTATITGKMQGASSVVNGIAHYDDADTVTYAMHVVPDDIQLSFHVHAEVASNGAWLPFTSTDVAGTARATGRRRSRPTRSDPVATA